MTQLITPRAILPGFVSRRVRIIVSGLMVAGLLGGVAPVFVASQIEATNRPEFCGSCHEMQVFHETWKDSVHGSAAGGVVSASCTDCHLPPADNGMVKYLATKGMSGARDILSHVRGSETDWVANLSSRNEFVYEDGCRKCHVELVAPEMPLKAFRAHRAVESGETSATCADCHSGVGHGDLKQKLQGIDDTPTLMLADAGRTATR